ncbi:MAG: polysaccharide pyruvyl transferase CsaB [Aminobacterium colombiense]|nr:polysaccharide pyruvyl transferase CsaB [Aminobacterium colombiense]
MARSDYGLSRPFAAALAGYYGFNNLGDELLATSAIHYLEKNGVPRERIVVLSASPEETASSFGTHAVDRWSFLEVYRTLRRSEVLLFGGGGLFQDSTSLRSCVYYWGLLHMARIAGCPSAVLAQSIGPFRTGMGAWLARNALTLCKVRTVRDQRSLDVLHSWDLAGELVPDLVMGLSFSKQENAPLALLVNLRPWEGDLSVLTAKTVARYARQHALPVIGVGMAPEDVQLLRSFSASGLLPCKDIRLVRNWREIEEIWSLGGQAVGMRLHFCMISLLAGCPVVAVPYDPKVEAFAKNWGIPLLSNKDLPLVPWPVSGLERVAYVRQECGRSMEKTWKEMSFHEKTS